jgi:hypothetical protein
MVGPTGGWVMEKGYVSHVGCRARGPEVGGLVLTINPVLAIAFNSICPHPTIPFYIHFALNCHPSHLFMLWLSTQPAPEKAHNILD